MYTVHGSTNTFCCILWCVYVLERLLPEPTKRGLVGNWEMCGKGGGGKTLTRTVHTCWTVIVGHVRNNGISAIVFVGFEGLNGLWSVAFPKTNSWVRRRLWYVPVFSLGRASMLFHVYGAERLQARFILRREHGRPTRQHTHA